MLLNIINSNNSTKCRFALFDLGFRPFFLGGMSFAILSIIAWTFVFAFHVDLETTPLTSYQWHSHEMIYGYTIAVIVGFLLTAILNWTGIQTAKDKSLACLFFLWLSARILFLFGSKYLFLAAIFDLAFIFSALFLISLPLIKSKSYKQLGVISKVLLLALGNFFFYLGCFGYFERGIEVGIYGGLYLIISLILTIGSRVMPGFITNGVDYKVEISSPNWISQLGLILFICFFINELFFKNIQVGGILSLALFFINVFRLYFWHTPGIWKKPLLWGLYLAFCFITIGFFLFYLSAFHGVSKFLAIHAFAYGGIGMATLSMISRVTLGHTGRSIKNPPKSIGYAFGILFLGAIFRIFVPLLEKNGYVFWIFLAQILWIISFLVILITYCGMLIKPKVEQVG